MIGRTWQAMVHIQLPRRAEEANCSTSIEREEHRATEQVRKSSSSGREATLHLVSRFFASQLLL